MFASSGSTSVAIGFQALSSSTTPDIVAIGINALLSMTSGVRMTAVGANSMQSSTTATDNTARSAPVAILGDNNTVVGTRSLTSLTNGSFNTVCGSESMTAATGSSNTTALGYRAGQLSTGNNNMYLGQNAGVCHVGDNAIFVGDVSDASIQTIYVAGILNGTGLPPGLSVVIDTQGRLSAPTSSIKDKTDIKIDSPQLAGKKLDLLRPVTYHYKTDLPEAPIRHGLIAEEVDMVFPETVVRSVDPKSQEETIRGINYEQFISVLIAGLQDARKQIASQRTLIEMMMEQIAEQDAAIDDLADRVSNLS